MQFKHPEVLWALLLLLLPLIVHLFQLRRFKKTAFTNVAMLRKVVSESRKSNTLKRWLLLLTRCLILIALVLAFAQPHFSEQAQNPDREWVVYLDDSFSMQAKSNGQELFEIAVQDLIKKLPKETPITLFTNNETFTKVKASHLTNKLLELAPRTKQLSLEQVVQKAASLMDPESTSLSDLVVISDFQTNFIQDSFPTTGADIHAVRLSPDATRNIALDSVYFGKTLNRQRELVIEVSGLDDEEKVPVSMFDRERLIAKSAIEPSSTGKNQVVFSIPIDEPILGTVSVQDNGLSYDNTFYFSIGQRPKIKVLAINGAGGDYLERIYTEDEFELTSTAIERLNYSSIAGQNLVVLNGLESIPLTLQDQLGNFHAEGGAMVIVPGAAIDETTYSAFLGRFFPMKFNQGAPVSKKISKIDFSHPLFENVFEKQISNFEFPQVDLAYDLDTGASKILSFADDSGFLYETDNIYVFSAPLDREHSNFRSAPLIVPTFYRMGLESLKGNALYFNVEHRNEIDLELRLDKDDIVSLYQGQQQRIPQQRALGSKVRLITDTNSVPSAGIYTAVSDSDSIQRFAFNHLRDESKAGYVDLEVRPNFQVYDSVPSLFETLEERDAVYAYWKWFVIFALVFALVELLLQKFLA
ncbi:BatA domain-containing protein [Flagellimonas sp. DF-77]|uniref:BatA domain-containing protein n=1 Tax=Flagellimonas algarum TaxID=3230298 RepID=UPI00339B0B9B